MLKKNDIVELYIDNLNDKGEGIGRSEGMVFFVKGVLPGDRLRCRVTKVKKTYAYARMEEILKPSENRIEPPCSVATRCGGCSIMALSYDAQLRWKEDRVRDCLIRIGGFADAQIEKVFAPIIGMEEPFGYRNKAQIPVGNRTTGSDEANGTVCMGFYAPFSHRIIENEGCLIGHPTDHLICEIIKKHMTSYNIPAYDEASGVGTVRHIIIRHSMNRQGKPETMVVLVVNASVRNRQEIERMLNIEALIQALTGAKEQDIDALSISSIGLNENTARTNVILGPHTETVYGASVIEDTFLASVADGTRKTLVFQISAHSFYQVNPKQMQRLYDTAILFAGLTGKEIVYDLYCGIGTISLAAALQAKEVYGVEVVEAAIQDAKENAQKNGIQNANFYAGKTEEVLPTLWQKTKSGEEPTVVIVDPPRKGCDIRCLETILAIQPERIVYVSCDPATLARDLKVLCDGADGVSYRLEKVQAVDQFCHSGHVETCVLLSRETCRRPDAKIKIDIDLDDYYAIKNRETK